MTRDNHFLGRFDLSGIPPVPQIEMIFDLDANGIVQVSAMEKSAGKFRSICITNDKDRLSEEEIERMLKEAKQYKKDDAEPRERIAFRNSLESYIYSAMEAAELASSDTLSIPEKVKIKETCESVIRWLDNSTDCKG